MVRHRIANPFFAGSNPVGHSISYCIQMKDKIQIYINKKQMTYSRPNIVSAINAFIPYLTNDDLVRLTEDVFTIMGQRKEAEEKSIEEGKNIPIQSNRHDT